MQHPTSQHCTGRENTKTQLLFSVPMGLLIECMNTIFVNPWATSLLYATKYTFTDIYKFNHKFQLLNIVISKIPLIHF